MGFMTRTHASYGNFNAEKNLYLLTPKGIEERARITLRFLKRKTE
jgi:hypothetical protein